MCTKYSILIAEDDAVMRNVIKVSLERNGFRVEAVGDGMAALHSFGEGHYDLVILDIRMPEMDGYELCRQLRKRTTVPIIIVTSESDIDVVSGYELGADIYVTKPFRPNELVLRVEALLRRVEVGKRQNDEDLPSAGRHHRGQSYDASSTGR
ncbi:MAG: response regulator transcription factor [Caldilineaceae bacterium]